RPFEIDRQEPILERGACDLDSLGEDEGLLELPRGDAAVKKGAFRLVLLAAADDEVVLLDADVEFVFREAGDRKRDAQRVATGPSLRQAFDIVRRITVPGSLAQASQCPLALIEAEEEWA